MCGTGLGWGQIVSLGTVAVLPFKYSRAEIPVHGCCIRTDRRTNIMAIARRFVLMNALRAENAVRFVEVIW